MSSLLETRLIETHKSATEYRNLVLEACKEADMPPGDNIHQLPNMIKKLRRERDYYQVKCYQMEETFIRDQIDKERDNGGWR